MRETAKSGISSRLFELRKALNLNQKEIADRLNITRAYWSALERGERRPSANVIEELNSQFEISSDWLLKGNGSPTTSGIGLNETLAFAEIENLYHLLGRSHDQIMYLIEIREKVFGEDEGYNKYLNFLEVQMSSVDIQNLDEQSIDVKRVLGSLKDLLPAFKADFDDLFHQYFMDVIHPRGREKFEPPKNVYNLKHKRK